MEIDQFENARANAKHAHDIAKARGDEVLMDLAAAFIALAKGLDEELTAIHDRLDQIESSSSPQRPAKRGA